MQEIYIEQRRVAFRPKGVSFSASLTYASGASRSQSWKAFGELCSDLVKRSGRTSSRRVLSPAPRQMARANVEFAFSCDIVIGDYAQLCIRYPSCEKKKKMFTDPEGSAVYYYTPSRSAGCHVTQPPDVSKAEAPQKHACDPGLVVGWKRVSISPLVTRVCSAL